MTTHGLATRHLPLPQFSTTVRAACGCSKPLQDSDTEIPPQEEFHFSNDQRQQHRQGPSSKQWHTPPVASLARASSPHSCQSLPVAKVHTTTGQNPSVSFDGLRPDSSCGRNRIKRFSPICLLLIPTPIKQSSLVWLRMHEGCQKLLDTCDLKRSHIFWPGDDQRHTAASAL